MYIDRCDIYIYFSDKFGCYYGYLAFIISYLRWICIQCNVIHILIVLQCKTNVNSLILSVTQVRIFMFLVELWCPRCFFYVTCISRLPHRDHVCMVHVCTSVHLCVCWSITLVLVCSCVCASITIPSICPSHFLFCPASPGDTCAPWKALVYWVIVHLYAHTYTKFAMSKV